MDTLLQDFRYAVRQLLRSPGFAAVAILSLALGIGANTAIFSLIDAVILRSLPVPHPEELVQVTLGHSAGGVFTNPLWEEIRDRQDVLSGSFAYADQSFDLATGGVSRPVDGTWVSGGFFSTLGLTPAQGRLLVPSDDQRGCPAVAVLGYGFWQSQYGGDPGVVGRTLSLDDHPFEIVGVAPAGFSGVNVGRSTQLFAPLCAKAILAPPDGGLENKGRWFLHVMGRLKEGVTVEQAGARLTSLAPTIFTATLSPEWNAEMRHGYLENTISVLPGANGYSELRSQYGRALSALMIVVGLVLLIACANVANLLLARATSRRREVAIRLAVGAGRGRLVRQLLTEGLLLSLAGAALGIVFAIWATQILVGFISAGDNPVWLDLSLDGRVLAFTAAVAVLTGVLFGLAPAWRSARVSAQAAMKSSDRTIAEGHSRFTAGKALVVGQITLSLVLVMGAGLLLRSFRKLATLDPGFRSEGVLLASLDLRSAGYSEDQLGSVKREILDRLRAAPGVRAASASEITPISGTGWNDFIAVDGFAPQGQLDALVDFNAVTPGYFAALRTPLLAGRAFTSRDRAGSVPVAVINEALAKKFFGGRNPLGERIGLVRPGEPEPHQFLEVVGVVADAKYGSLREETREQMYLPMSQGGWNEPSVHVELRTDGAPTSLIPTVQAVSAEISPRISLEFTTLAEQVASSLSRERLLATLSGFFGALALLLAAIGLYGTLSYNVARRRNEIGIRMALGADPGAVLRSVLREAGALVGLGLLLGGVAALAAPRLVSSFLYGLSPTDATVFCISVLALVAAAAVAGALPAWRATRVDPIEALRTE